MLGQGGRAPVRVTIGEIDFPELADGEQVAGAGYVGFCRF